jgi:hypothetical protein
LSQPAATIPVILVIAKTIALAHTILVTMGTLKHLFNEPPKLIFRYVTASIENITTTTGVSFKVYNNDYWSNVNAFLNVNYPISRQFGCYYSFSGSSGVTIQLGLYPVESVWIAGYVMAGFAATTLLIWMIWELVVCLSACNCKCDPCRACRDCRDRIKLNREAKLAHQRDLVRRDLEAQRQLSRAANTTPESDLGSEVTPSAPPFDLQ